MCGAQVRALLENHCGRIIRCERMERSPAPHALLMGAPVFLCCQFLLLSYLQPCCKLVLKQKHCPEHDHPLASGLRKCLCKDTETPDDDVPKPPVLPLALPSTSQRGAPMACAKFFGFLKMPCCGLLGLNDPISTPHVCSLEFAGLFLTASVSLSASFTFRLLW